MFKSSSPFSAEQCISCFYSMKWQGVFLPCPQDETLVQHIHVHVDTHQHLICWYPLKPWPNNYNMSTQHSWAQHVVEFGHPVATCCDMLQVVGSNLRIDKFFMQHLWMLHDHVVVVWPGLCIYNVALGYASKFDF